MAHAQRLEYGVYTGLLLYPLVAAYVVCYGTYLIMIFYNIRKNNIENPVSDLLSGFVNFTFLGRLTRERVEVEPGKKKSYTILRERSRGESGTTQMYKFFGFPVSPGYVRLLFFASLVIWVTMFLSFWSTFLIQYSGDCNKNWDCFYGSNNVRVENCEQAYNASQSVECFRLQLDFIRGAGSAGGIQGLMVTFQYGQIQMFAWLKKKMSQSLNKRSWIIKAGSATTIVFTLELLIFAGGTAFLYSPIYPFSGYIKLLAFLTLLFLTVSVFTSSIFTACFLGDKEKATENSFSSSSQINKA